MTEPYPGKLDVYPIDLPKTEDELLVWALLHADLTQNFQNYYYKMYKQQGGQMPRSHVMIYVRMWLNEICALVPHATELKRIHSEFATLYLYGIPIKRVLNTLGYKMEKA